MPSRRRQRAAYREMQQRTGRSLLQSTAIDYELQFPSFPKQGVSQTAPCPNRALPKRKNGFGHYIVTRHSLQAGFQKIVAHSFNYEKTSRRYFACFAVGLDLECDTASGRVGR